MTASIGEAKRQQKRPLEGAAAEALQHLRLAYWKSKSFYGREKLVRQMFDAIQAAVNKGGASTVIAHGCVIVVWNVLPYYCLPIYNILIHTPAYTPIYVCSTVRVDVGRLPC